MAHDEIRLRSVDGTLVGTEQQALALTAALLDRVEDAAVRILPEVARSTRNQCREHGSKPRRDRALLDHHAVLELLCAAQIDKARDAGPDRICVSLRRIAHPDAVNGHVVV